MVYGVINVRRFIYFYSRNFGDSKLFSLLFRYNDRKCTKSSDNPICEHTDSRTLCLIFISFGISFKLTYMLSMLIEHTIDLYLKQKMHLFLATSHSPLNKKNWMTPVAAFYSEFIF